VSVSYTSYEALAVSYAINMIGGSTTYGGLCVRRDGGAGTYTYTDTVVESVGGLTENQFTGIGGTEYAVDFFKIMAVVDPPSPAVPQEIALHTYGYSGSIDVGMHVYVETTDTPAESLRRVRNTAGAIRSEIQAQFGSASCLQRGTVRIGQIYLLDETKYLKGYAFVPMTIDWSSP